jgi:hypothetical protein
MTFTAVHYAGLPWVYELLLNIVSSRKCRNFQFPQDRPPRDADKEFDSSRSQIKYFGVILY